MSNLESDHTEQLSTGESRADRPSTDESVDEKPDSASSPDRLELRAQLEQLELENDRLREEYARARRSQYQKTAFGLAALGTLAVLGGVLFPASRDVLVAIGATGLFGSVLTYYLTPEQFVPASVGEHIYTTSAKNAEAIVDGLELRDDRVYIPGSEATPAKLYVPQRSEYDRPDIDGGPFVVEPAQRGLLLEATGSSLVSEFEQAVTGGVSTNLSVLSDQLTDALVEQFELATQATPSVDPAGDRITVEVTGSVFGPLDRFDHPIVSFLAVGIARALETPVTVEVTASEPAGDSWLITCRFDLEKNSSESEEQPTQERR